MADDQSNDSESIRQILEDLQLDHLLENFERNKITVAILPKLTEALIANLIPIIGEQAIFTEFWKKHYKPKLSEENGPDGKKRNTENSTELGPTQKKRKEAEDKTAQADSTSKTNKEYADMQAAGAFVKETTKSVKTVLEQSDAGRKLLKSYQLRPELIDEQRKLLCNLIITDLENSSIKLEYDLADIISKMIVEIFPSESLGTYYVPTIPKKDTKDKIKTISARGKLLSMWKNRKFKESKLQKRITKEAKQKETESPEENISEDVKNSLQWIDENEAPWNLVIEHWKKTSSYRCKEIQQLKNANLSDIFQQWKLYTHLNGHELIDIDFQCMNLTKIKLDKAKWMSFFETLSQNATINVKDATANSLLDQMKSENVSDDSIVAMSLHLIAHLYPPKQMKKINGVSFKPSIGLAKDSILQIARIPSDMTRIRQNTKTRLKELKLNGQPYILIIGSMEKDIQDVYVCIDDVLYKSPTILQAVDICFKSFHVLDLQYPAASQHLWLMIQKGLYSFDSVGDPYITSIQHVLKKLANKNKAVDA